MDVYPCVIRFYIYIPLRVFINSLWLLWMFHIHYFQISLGNILFQSKSQLFILIHTKVGEISSHTFCVSSLCLPSCLSGDFWCLERLNCLLWSPSARSKIKPLYDFTLKVKFKIPVFGHCAWRIHILYLITTVTGPEISAFPVPEQLDSRISGKTCKAWNSIPECSPILVVSFSLHLNFLWRLSWKE